MQQKDYLESAHMKFKQARKKRKYIIAKARKDLRNGSIIIPRLKLPGKPLMFSGMEMHPDFGVCRNAKLYGGMKNNLPWYIAFCTKNLSLRMTVLGNVEKALKELQIKAGCSKCKENSMSTTSEVITRLMREIKDFNILFEMKFKTPFFKNSGWNQITTDLSTPCNNRTDFVIKICSLALLINEAHITEIQKAFLQNGYLTMNDLALPGKYGNSKDLLELFVTKRDPNALTSVDILRKITQLRNKTSPVHAATISEITKILNNFGFNYPPQHWNMIWRTVLTFAENSFRYLIQIFGSKKGKKHGI
jgi:hypothetical protein